MASLDEPERMAESKVYPCNVDSADSLRVDTEFSDGRFGPDLQFEITAGKIRERYSVWMSKDNIRDIYRQLGEALRQHDWG